MTPITDSFPSLRGEQSGAVRLLQALRRRWLLIAAFVVVAVVAAGVFSYTTAKRYEASADILVSPLSPNDTTFQGFSLVQQTFGDSSPVITAARIMNSPEIRRPAFARLGDAARGASVDIRPLGQASIVSVVASAPRATEAATVANRYAEFVVAERTRLFQAELSRRLAKLKAQAAAIPKRERSGNFQYASLEQAIAGLAGYVGTSDPTLRVLTEANVPLAPVWPRPVFSMVAALLAALLLGGGIAALLEFATPHVSDEDELLLGHRLPILARIPRLPSRVIRDYLSGRGALPRGAWKGYRTLRAVLAAAGTDGGYPRTILLTSASPSDGKTTTAVNLAVTLAASSVRVILVDADMHRPMVATIFNVAARRDGLSRLMMRRGTPDASLVQAPAHPGLRLLLTTQESGGQLQGDGGQFKRVLEELRAEADVIVIDSPPIPEVAEVLAMADAVDCVLVSVRLGHTRRDKLTELREMLARRGVHPAGFVVTTRERLRRETDYDYPGDIAATRQAAAAALEERMSGERPAAIRLVDR